MFTSLMQYIRVILTVAGLMGLTLLFYHGAKTVIHKFSPLNIRHKGLRLCLTLMCIILSISTFLGLSSIYVYYGFGHQPDIYRHGSRDLPMVSLTFDDGPSPDFTPEILEILKKYHVSAAFFLIGSNVEKYPEIALKILEDGHEIGNHTQNHRNIPTLSNTDLHQEILEAAVAITDATNQYPDFIRPPRGMYDGRFRRLTALLGQQVVLWTVSSKDWQKGVTAENIVKNVVNHIKNGDIILFHDSGALFGKEGGDRSATVKALPTIIEKIQQKGYQIVPLKTLLNEEAQNEPLSSILQD
ncbi:MAG: polysaccharide deacetylase family protein [Dehalobacterium sp.]